MCALPICKVNQNEYLNTVHYKFANKMVCGKIKKKLNITIIVLNVISKGE